MPQGVLDRWIDQGKATLSADHLFIKHAQTEYEMKIQPGVYFHREDAKDPTHDLGWLGKVKSEAEVLEHGVEIVSDSAIVGEAAYGIHQGMMLELISVKKAQSEIDMLSMFFLGGSEATKT